MKAASIPNHENTFQSTGVDCFGKRFILKEGIFPIKGTAESIKIMGCARENGDKSFYYQEETAKKKVVLHFTMGYLKGDIGTLTNSHVSVPFVIGRNGLIYNLFASKYWSYHLGPGSKGGNTAMSRECIGIEISNIGPLKKIGDNLVTAYSDTDIYCSLAETQYYTRLPARYRNFEYFATYTPAQYAAIRQLLMFLCAKYNLPKSILPEPQRYQVMDDARFKNYTGIASHVNCRVDKVDIGPAFDWNKIM